MRGADAALLAAVIATAACKRAALPALAHLVIWVAGEQRARE